MELRPIPFQFQSLVGFKINWNFSALMDSVRPCWFQSLVGFKINWNIALTPQDARAIAFQSLVGFKINWNSAAAQPQEPLTSRFNP
ncbi:hypothetical protein MICAG_1180001 [Microcystis aeruginosa PCC 9808]|uniref:Uncharacterized protein n=1 Tax=Microcystis aeruginosa PCC 9808 TaxID=1160284 RepID=I4HG42_MICAE|nr:hypothetical protein MICAG_1180001 [Microcystis aeruginosa PCC 9808]